MEWSFQMSSQGDPRRRADAVRNRQSVLAATRTLLGDAGATNTGATNTGATITVDAIARQAGVGAATVVRTFGSKEALIDVAVAELLEPVVQRAREALSETDAHDALRRFLVDLIAFQSGHWVISHQLRELDLPHTSAQRDALTKAVAALVRRARDEGSIRADLELEVTLGLMGELSQASPPSADASPRLAESYVAVLMDGLRPPHS
jgi:AcrR family transcriptional regulator